MPEAYFDPSTYGALEAHETGHFWHETRRELIRWMAHRYFPRPNAVCEVGCGTGFVMQGLRDEWSGALVLGVEVYAEAIPIVTARNPGSPIVRASALNLPFKETLDVVCAFDVIEHIDDDFSALQQFHGTLRPGGGLMLSVPQHMSLWSYHDEFQHHKRRYSRRDLLKKLSGAGFTIKLATSFTSILFPLMWIRRRIAKDGRAPDADRAPPHLVNAALTAVMRLEVAATRRGMRWPLGGSLFVVAVRAN